MAVDDSTYQNFMAALHHVISDGGRGTQASIAYGAELSPGYLSRVVNGTKKAGFDAQVDIARSAGFLYQDFLELGRSLLEPENTSANLPPGPINRADTSPIDLLLEVAMNRFRGADLHLIQDGDDVYICDRKQRDFIDGELYGISLNGVETARIAKLFGDKPVFIVNGGPVATPGAWGEPWLIGRVVINAVIRG